MKVICAPDSFKESMSAAIAAAALAQGVCDIEPDATTVEIPLADGGEGTAQALADATGGHLEPVPCHDALGRPHLAQLGWLGDGRTAVVEVAQAVGLAQIAPDERNLCAASSYGVGELVRAALDGGATTLIVGLGGSATNDAGAGMMRALGAHFLDASHAELPDRADALAGLAAADLCSLDPRLADVRVRIASDVTAPLLGPKGASVIFGPQKGASPSEIELLDSALARWADGVESAIGRRVRDCLGAGAAGGLGAAFQAMTGAFIEPGAELVMDAVGLDASLADADVVYTGEGSVDGQTASGKTPWAVAQRARRAGVPVVMFAGRVTDAARTSLVDDALALVPIVTGPCTLEEALAQGPANLRTAARQATALLLGGVPRVR